MSYRPRSVFEFGPYRLDVTACRLLHQGEEIALRPKLFDLLVVLVKRNGEVLSKDELLATVWPEAIVEESNLSVSINALRKALNQESYIETVARRGYRFTAPVKLVSSDTSLRVGPVNVTMAPPNGALPLDSPLYITRAVDVEFTHAIARQDSTVLVKGSRQVGKTSLLARGLYMFNETATTVVLTDFQQITGEAFQSVDTLLLTVAELLADQLGLNVAPHETWNKFIG